MPIKDLIQKGKDFLLSNFAFFIPLSIFLLSILVISPLGNYPVNDDWQFYTHVRYFLEGNYIKNPLIDSSFILQGFIALFWVQISGLSFISLRILTIIFTIIFFIGFYKILRYLKINQNLILIAFLCLLLEPFILNSSLTFMTEIYFLSFLSWSAYFLLKFLDSQDKSFENKYFILAVTIGSLSILIRQFGIVLLIAYLITFFYIFKFQKKYFLIFFLTIFFFGVSILINLSFPQYSGLYSSKEEKMLHLFANFSDIGEKISYYPKYLVYLTFFLAPLIINFVNKKHLSKILILSLPLSILIFLIDIFDLKNIFHLECYYCESYFSHEYSLFDNVPFKFLFSYFISFLFLESLIKIYGSFQGKIFSSMKIEGKNFALAILSLGMLLVILAIDSFYDRYFINFGVLFITLIFYNLKNVKISKYAYFTFGLLYLIILLLNIDFHNSMYYKWNQAINLYEKTDKRLKAQIFATGTFSRFMNAQEKTPEYLLSPIKWGVQKCFVLRHVQKQDNLVINFFNSKIFNNKYIKNPTFSNQISITELPKTKDNLDKVIQINEYFSPIYNLLGQKTYIISFCNEEVTKRFNIKTENNSWIK